ncbi:hypothetical protein CKAH01_14840 [Colletotrichum kahawae]|uniref:Uncharacterized protein n=1 Tax=Colletotrichum kahawae TaxID=34407 RepID=A0AAD9YML4_COLKA|nr:hypothetical protein CKAH01_14840 [Colletotrichum kahawae]
MKNQVLVLGALPLIPFWPMLPAERAPPRQLEGDMLRRLGDVRQDLDPMQMQQEGGTAAGGADAQGPC